MVTGKCNCMAKRELQSSLGHHFVSVGQERTHWLRQKPKRPSLFTSFRLCNSLVFLTIGLSLSAASYSAQYTASGTIVAFRNHTLSYPSAPVQGYSILQVSTPFSNGCAWVFLTAADKNALAVILTAKAVGSSVLIYYDNTIGAPWGDPTTCAVIAIDYN